MSQKFGEAETTANLTVPEQVRLTEVVSDEVQAVVQQCLTHIADARQKKLFKNLFNFFFVKTKATLMA